MVFPRSGSQTGICSDSNQNLNDGPNVDQTNANQGNHLDLGPNP